jgi:hypothetical protein
VTENVTNVRWNIGEEVLEDIWCYVYERVTFRRWIYLFEYIAYKDYHNVLWEKHMRSSLLYVGSYFLEADDERLHYRCTLSYRHLFFFYWLQNGFNAADRPKRVFLRQAATTTRQ